MKVILCQTNLKPFTFNHFIQCHNPVYPIQHILCTIDLSSYCTLLTSTVAEFSSRKAKLTCNGLMFIDTILFTSEPTVSNRLPTVSWDLKGSLNCRSRTDHHLTQMKIAKQEKGDVKEFLKDSVLLYDNPNPQF